MEYIWTSSNSMNALHDGILQAKMIITQEQEGWKVYVIDFTKPKPELINGSPFEGINMAKSVLEYHFGLHTDRRTEITA